MTTAIVLAAGKGARLGAINNGKTKTQLIINDLSLISRIVNGCVDNGIDNFIIVTGFSRENLTDEVSKLTATLGAGCTFIENPEYDMNNTGESLRRGLMSVKDDVVIFNGDIIYDPRILSNLIQANGTTIVVDDVKELTPESFKIQIDKDGRIVRMGKEIDADISLGEFIGLSKVVLDDLKSMREELDRLVKENIKAYYDLAFIDLSSHGKVNIIGTDGMSWTEIDTPEDFEIAKDIAIQIDRVRGT